MAQSKSVTGISRPVNWFFTEPLPYFCFSPPTSIPLSQQEINRPVTHPVRLATITQQAQTEFLTRRNDGR